jgi:hypothetical protein
MAWDINTYNAADPSAYIVKWAAENFGKENASSIARIKNLYYQLAQAGKPEHVGLLKFTAKEINERLEAYQKLNDMLDSCKMKIDKKNAAAFYQLVSYPVESSCLMNYKVLRQQLAFKFFNEKNISEAKENLQQAQTAYGIILELTERYNRFIANGKWNGMMSWHPRDQKVFNAPVQFDSLIIKTDSAVIKKETKEAQLVLRVSAQQMYQPKICTGCLLMNGVGISGSGITTADKARDVLLSYHITLNAGTYSIVVKCLPTFAMEKERQLTYTISLAGAVAQTVNVNAEAESAIWKENVLKGYSTGETVHTLNAGGPVILNIELKNKNLVVNQIEIYKVQ